MPFDGSGNFNRVMDWTNDAAANIKIRADRHDQNDDDIASGLSNTITKDGQSQPTADIPMNGKKLINLGAPVNPTDAATKATVDLKADKASPTFTGKVTLPTGAAGLAPANLPVPAANPTTPVSGDFWPNITDGRWKYRLTSTTITFAAIELANTWSADQTFSTNIFVSGTGSLFGLANAAGQVSIQGNSVEVGINRTVDGPAFYDLHGTTGTDYDARLIRNTGVNGSLQLVNNGTGGLQFSSGGAAGTFTYNSAPILVQNIDNLALAAGFGAAAAISDGTKSSGTYTPSMAGGNIRSITNGGAFSLAADANNTTAYTGIVMITNSGTAGAITQSGWSKAWDGDPLTTTNGAVFLLFITKIGSVKVGTIMQVV